MARSFKGQRDNGLRTIVGSQVRVFVQPYAAAPAVEGNPNPLLDYGLTQITDAFSKERPEPTIIEVPSRLLRNQWQKVGQVPQSISAGTVAFQAQVNADGAEDWTYWVDKETQLVWYFLVGDSSSPENPNQWVSKYVLYPGSVYAVQPLGENLNPKTGEDNAEQLLTGNLFFWDAYKVRTLSTSRVGSATVTRSVVAVDGTYTKYDYGYVGVTANVAATTPSAVVYGEGTGAYTQTNITALGTDGLASDVKVIADYVLVSTAVSGSEAHYYSTLSDVQNANNVWTEITSGYVATKGVNAIHPVSAANIMLVGQGGYIYRLRGVRNTPTVIDAGTVTTQNLLDVAGYNNFLVAVGAANTAIVSVDGGDTWASVTGASSGNALNAVDVVSPTTCYVGTSNGELWHGEYSDVTSDMTWTQVQLDGATPTVINDISFSQSIVSDKLPVFGYVAANDGSAGLLFRTTDGGNTFTNAAPEITRFSTALTGVTVTQAVVSLDPNEVFIGGTTSGGGIAGVAR